MPANKSTAEGLSVLIWASVFSASVFAVSDDYPGAMLEPKWYGAVLVAMAGGLLWIAYCHIARLRVFSMAFSRGMEVAALIVCSSQALFMLLIEIGICPTYGRYAVGCCFPCGHECGGKERT